MATHLRPHGLRIVAATALLAVVAALAAGCGGRSPTQPESGQAGGQQPAGQEQPTGQGQSAGKAQPSGGEQPAGGGVLTIYSGRSEELVGPIIERFKARTGIEVKVRYGGTSELAATLLEEGSASPADVFFAQDAGALGAVQAKGLLRPLPETILGRVEPRFRSPRGLWVGTSGRARVVAYNTKRLKETDLPDSIHGFTDPKWKGRIGWPPTNASFQAFVTALRLTEGDEAAKRWLEGILANQPREYPSNVPAVEAVAAGEVDVAFVNHYYLHRLKAERGPGFPVANAYLKAGDAGALINVAGAGILAGSKNPAAAERFVEFLLSEEAQEYFAKETYEYPLVKGVKTDPALPPLESIHTPDLDLGNLADLEKTLNLLREVGAL